MGSLTQGEGEGNRKEVIVEYWKGKGGDGQTNNGDESAEPSD